MDLIMFFIINFFVIKFLASPSPGAQLRLIPPNAEFVLITKNTMITGQLFPHSRLDQSERKTEKNLPSSPWSAIFILLLSSESNFFSPVRVFT